jgi:hypothetical protein
MTNRPFFHLQISELTANLRYPSIILQVLLTGIFPMIIYGYEIQSAPGAASLAGTHKSMLNIDPLETDKTR